MWPKQNFQKYLDGEITTEAYSKKNFLEIVQRAIIFDLLSILCLLYLSKYLIANANGEIALFYEQTAGICCLYLVLSWTYRFLDYSGAKKNAKFFIAVKQEDEQNRRLQHPDYLPLDQFNYKIPSRLAKFYLDDKVSKLDYVKAFLNFKVNFLRGAFIFFMIGSFILFSFANIDILTTVSCSYLIALGITWVIKVRASGLMNIGLNRILEQKQIRKAAFANAENAARVTK